MAELKTQVTEASVENFLEGIEDEKKRRDCFQLLKIMKKATRAKPKMWGTSIVGFGDYHYVYKTGREGNWFITGFSPRAQNLTVYMMGGFDGEALKRLGKYKTGKGCLYIRRLEDVNLEVLSELITTSVKKAKAAAK